MNYIGIPIGSSYLKHYGRLGMKWYQHIFGDDPRWGSNGRNSKGDDAEKPHYKSTYSIQQKYKNYDYGVYQNGKNVTKASDIDYNKYRTQSVAATNKHKVGICWDIVAAQSDALKKAGVQHSTYFYIKRAKDGSIDTHTFIISDTEVGKVWSESSWGSHLGNYTMDYKQVVDELNKEYGKGAYDVVQYDPGAIKPGLTSREFIDRVYNDGTMKIRKSR